MSFSYKLGTKFADVCKNLCVNDRDGALIWKVLVEGEGYTERALCFVATKCEDKLSSFVGDNRFASIFINEVKKHAYKPCDPRWNKQ